MSEDRASQASAPAWSLDSGGTATRLIPTGSWTLGAIAAQAPSPPKLNANSETIQVDGSKLEALDTAGAKMMIDHLSAAGHEEAKITGFAEGYERIFKIVLDRVTGAAPLSPTTTPNIVLRAADTMLERFKSTQNIVSFFGEMLVNGFHSILHPSTIRPSDTTIQFERTTLRAIPIVALVNFLIGLVLAYLFAGQAAKFGASIFVVDTVSIGVCRELSPILTAILIAGRSGSAFTAQLGIMKMGQEVDAIRVMGLSPIKVLVMPRILALVFGLPLLVFIGNIAGIFGGFVIANTLLEIPTSAFLDRMQSVLQLKHVYIGLAKAPVFAVIIALISCRLGLTVEDNARSVGLNTTSTVVSSIVAVILLDAFFAVLFQELGW